MPVHNSYLGQRPMHPTPYDPRAVILDYGMVLCRKPSVGEIDRIAQLFDVDHTTFWQLYEQHRGAYDKNDISGKEYWGRFARDTKTRLDDDTLEQLLRWDIEIWSNLEEPLLSWTRSLRVAGFKTALLSNLHLRFSAHIRSSSEWLRFLPSRLGTGAFVLRRRMNRIKSRVVYHESAPAPRSQRRRRSSPRRISTDSERSGKVSWR